MTISRRDLIATAAVAIAASGGRLSAAPPRALLLVDPTLPSGTSHVPGHRDDTRRLDIELDLVRQWRDGLGARISAAGAALAVVRWDKALLIGELAREDGLRTRRLRKGRGTFLVTIERPSGHGRGKAAAQVQAGDGAGEESWSG